MQMWLRKSNVSRRWIHLLRLCLSLHASVDKTLNSMRLASRYFCTERMILMATSAFLLRSYACTTLPKVPWPRSFTIESAGNGSVLHGSDRVLKLRRLTSLGQVGVVVNNIMSIIIVNLLVTLGRSLRSCQLLRLQSGNG